MSEIAGLLAVNFTGLLAVILLLWAFAATIRDVSFIDAVWPLGMVLLAAAAVPGAVTPAYNYQGCLEAVARALPYCDASLPLTERVASLEDWNATQAHTSAEAAVALARTGEADDRALSDEIAGFLAAMPPAVSRRLALAREMIQGRQATQLAREPEGGADPERPPPDRGRGR